MEPLLKGLLRSLGGSEANFLELCFGRFPYGNFHTKATSKKFRPPSGNFRQNPPELPRSPSTNFSSREAGWKIILDKSLLYRLAKPRNYEIRWTFGKNRRLIFKLSSTELESGNPLGASLQTTAPVLDRISGPMMGAGFLSSTGLGFSNLIERERESNSSQYLHWIEIGLQKKENFLNILQYSEFLDVVCSVDGQGFCNSRCKLISYCVTTR